MPQNNQNPYATPNVYNQADAANTGNQTPQNQQMPNDQADAGAVNSWFGGPWIRSLASMVPTAIADYFGNKFYASAQDNAYQKYRQRMQDVSNLASTFTQSSPQANLSSFWNAAGDLGANVPRAYERALSQVRPTADSVYASAQAMNLAGQLLGAADASTRLASAQAATQAEGIRRQAAQAAQRTGSANALRDILAETAQRSIAASQGIADRGAQAYSQNAATAGQLMTQAPQLTQQSQLAQYQLFAKPREANLSPYAQATAQALLNHGVPYDTARPDYMGLQQALYTIGARQLLQAILGAPPTKAGERSLFDF